MPLSVSERITSETELIQTYLAPLAAGFPGAFGLMDDAALLVTEPGIDLVVSTDPVIAGVHFFADDAPRDIAWKAVAVNVSDLAAKGAEPFAYTLALAFPEAPRRDWMADFSAGLQNAQTAFGCHLAGGDTDRTTGPLSIGVTAFGKVPRGQMVGRRGAKPGDHVFVTGTIGDSALGLKLRSSALSTAETLTGADRQFLLNRYLRPMPRLAYAPLLRQYASASLDVSDGLLKDAGRLAAGSALRLNFAALPMSAAAAARVASDPNLNSAILSGGDDYEILFSVPAERCADFVHAAARQVVPATELGVLTAGSGITILSADGMAVGVNASGYDHFQSRGS